jgi:hypothetical protein
MLSVWDESAYLVKVKREMFNGSDCWVARDRTGAWRSYCKFSFSDDARDAARGMFHADEIESVNGDSNTAYAKIKTYIVSNGGRS